MKAIFTILTAFFFLNGSAQLIFHWRQFSGPLQTTIVNPDSANTLATGLNRVGVYGYELTLSDASQTWEDKDSMNVTVTGGALSINPDSVHHVIRPPKIEKLEIKTFARTSDIFIVIKSPRYQDVECIICDAMGRKIAKIDFPVLKGTNYFTAPKPTTAGVYFLYFTTYFDSPIVEKIPI